VLKDNVHMHYLHASKDLRLGFSMKRERRLLTPLANGT